MRVLLLALSVWFVLFSFSKDASAACPEKKLMSLWEDRELLKLAYKVEIDEFKDEKSNQKLSWRHYDKSCDAIAENRYQNNFAIYLYDSSDAVTGHTEFQMMRDQDFLDAAKVPGYMFIWSTQAPCVYGSKSSGRVACSDALPPFLEKNFPKTKFIFGFNSRKFARHEYKAMVSEGKDTNWDSFAEVLTEKWGKAANANLLVYGGDKLFKINNWIELVLLERSGVTTFAAAERRFYLRNKLRESKALSQSQARSVEEDEIPAHKKVLVRALEGGKKFPLSFVLGKEDGTIVGDITQGLAVPTPLPAGAVYIAVFANPFTESVEQYFKLANSVASAGGRVNVVFEETKPQLMQVSPTGLMDQQLKKTPLTKENLRVFTLVGSSHLPMRLWPAKAQAVRPPPAKVPTKKG